MELEKIGIETVKLILKVMISKITLSSKKKISNKDIF